MFEVTGVETNQADTWSGDGSNNLWSTPGNWLGDTVPAAGDNLVFPSGAEQETSVNDLGLTFNSFTIADAYSFSGQPLTTSSLTVGQGSLELDSSTTVTGTLTVEASASLTIGGDANLEIMNNASLDDEANLTIAANATLTDNNNVTVGSNASLDDQGTLTIVAKATLTDNNSVTVAGNAYLDDEGTLTVAPNASLTETASAGDPPNLTFTAPNVATPSNVQLNNGNYGVPDTFQLWSVNTTLVNEVLAAQGYTTGNGWSTSGTTVSLASDTVYDVFTSAFTFSNGNSEAGYLLRLSRQSLHPL